MDVEDNNVSTWAGALIGVIDGEVATAVIANIVSNNRVENKDGIAVVLEEAIVSPITIVLYTAVGILAVWLFGGIVGNAIGYENGISYPIYTVGQPIDALGPYALIQGDEPDNIRSLR